eukprot:2858815-Rhodomonas_salina.2
MRRRLRASRARKGGAAGEDGDVLVHGVLCVAQRAMALSGVPQAVLLRDRRVRQEPPPLQGLPLPRPPRRAGSNPLRPPPSPMLQEGSTSLLQQHASSPSPPAPMLPFSSVPARSCLLCSSSSPARRLMLMLLLGRAASIEAGRDQRGGG